LRRAARTAAQEQGRPDSSRATNGFQGASGVCLGAPRRCDHLEPKQQPWLCVVHLRFLPLLSGCRLAAAICEILARTRAEATAVRTQEFRKSPALTYALSQRRGRSWTPLAP